MQLPQLNSCPACALGLPELRGVPVGGVVAGPELPHVEVLFTVHCPTCGFGGPHQARFQAGTPEEAVGLWNRIEAPPRPGLAKLKHIDIESVFGL